MCHFDVTSNLLCLQPSQILDFVHHSAGFICVGMSIDSWMKLSDANRFNHGGFFASSGSLGVCSELQILMALFSYYETFDHEPCHQEECRPGTGGASLVKYRKVWDLLGLLHTVPSSHIWDVLKTVLQTKSIHFTWSSIFSIALITDGSEGSVIARQQAITTLKICSAGGFIQGGVNRNKWQNINIMSSFNWWLLYHEAWFINVYWK